MSLLESFLGNAAGAGAGILAEQAKNDFLSQERAKEARLQDELLTRRQKVIEAMREESEIRKEQRMVTNADAERLKVSGRINDAAGQIAQGKTDALMSGHEVSDPSTWTPEMEAARNQGVKGLMSSYAKDPRNLSKAALQTGDYAQAAAFDKMADSGTSTLKFGDQKIDSEGNVIAENDSLTKQQAELEKIRARNDGRVGKMVKPLTQDDMDKVADRAFKLVKNATDGLDHPYADQTGDKASKADTAYAAVLGKKLSSGLVNAQIEGAVIDPNQSVTELRKVLDSADMKLRKEADAEAKKIFSGTKNTFSKDSPDEQLIAKLKASGMPESALTDETAFKRYYRDSNLSAAFDAALAGGRKPTEQSKAVDAPQPAKKADDAPKAVITSAKTKDAAPERQEPSKPMSTLDQIQANNIEAVKPLAAQVKQAEATMAAVARSGDAKSAARYANELQSLRAKLEAEVNARFGNGAPAILASLR